jgi:exoribonuclease II
MGELEIPRIITADCSFPKEIDDGLFVRQLDENHELYQVGVCVVDTSKLYSNQDVVNQAFNRTAAKYWDLPGDERGYDPMVETDFIKELEFSAGNVRDALIVAFTVGRKQEPSNVDISFGQVEVVQNKSYKDFANYAVYSPKGKKFSRASEFIRDHLGYVAYGDHSGNQPQWREAQETTPNVSNRAWKRGSKMNEAFMVAANYLVGVTLAAEGRPAIYRVHDPQDEQYLELLSANVARYSRTPGPHMGLGLGPYCRVTSPLRRLDDFVMSHQLKKRFLGKDPTAQDARDVAFAVRRLNQEIIAAAPKEAARFSRHELLGRAAVSHKYDSLIAAEVEGVA